MPDNNTPLEPSQVVLRLEREIVGQENLANYYRREVRRTLDRVVLFSARSTDFNIFCNNQLFEAGEELTKWSGRLREVEYRLQALYSMRGPT